MSKISYAKLGLKINCSTKALEWKNNEENFSIEVKQYLPIEEKLDVISKIINESVDDNDYFNPARLEIFTTLEIIYAYTNLSITDKAKENPFKLYDNLVSSGLFDKILEVLPTEEFDMIDVTARSVIKNVYNYKNSALGIIKTLTEDYSQLNLDASDIQKKINDPESIALVKNIIEKLG